MAVLDIFINGDASGLQKGEGQAVSSLKRIDKAGSSLASSLASSLGAAFSVGALVAFGKQVLNVTAEFQKFGAVLSNTLGSKALADLKMKDIQDFAAKTPFGVNELTGAFVKLANAGFKPTGAEMTKLGDLASSTGKSFDQLAEAILDAQSGEFERLKEFGVRAKDAGDSVIFTYKGVQTTVEKTSGSIRDYITSLGAAEGVSGSMAKISQTLGGQISNLGDAWDQMLLSIGNNTQGVFSSAINVMNSALTKITQYNNELNIASKYKLGSNTKGFFEQLNRAINPFASKGATATELAVEGVKEAQDNVRNFITTALAGAKTAADFGKALAGLKKQGDIELKSPAIASENERKAIKDVYQEGVKAIQDARNNAANNTGADANFGKAGGADKKVKSVADILKELNDNLKVTENQFQATFDEKNTSKIDNYQSAIDELSKKTGVDAVNAINKLRDAQISLLQLGQFTPLSGSVNQGLPGQRNSLGQKGLDGITVSDPALQAFKDKQKSGDFEEKQNIKIAQKFNREMDRAIENFGGNFLSTLGNINQQADRSFVGIAASLTASLNSSLNDVFATQFKSTLKDLASGAKVEFKDAALAIAGVLGNLITGITSKTSTVGQAAGGALSGVAAGASLGADLVPVGGGLVGGIIGGLAGAIGGIFGASKAKKAEKLAAQQLAESQKQTRLLERQNALAYTASIIGRMTTSGVVTGVEVNEFGQLTTKISGQDIQITLDRANKSRQRGT